MSTIFNGSNRACRTTVLTLRIISAPLQHRSGSLNVGLLCGTIGSPGEQGPGQSRLNTACTSKILTAPSPVKS